MQVEKLDGENRQMEKDETVERLNESLARFMESLDKEEMACLKNVDLEIEAFRKMFSAPK